MIHKACFTTRMYHWKHECHIYTKDFITLMNSFVQKQHSTLSLNYTVVRCHQVNHAVLLHLLTDKLDNNHTTMWLE